MKEAGLEYVLQRIGVVNPNCLAALHANDETEKDDGDEPTVPSDYQAEGDSIDGVTEYSKLTDFQELMDETDKVDSELKELKEVLESQMSTGVVTEKAKYPLCAKVSSWLYNFYKRNEINERLADFVFYPPRPRAKLPSCSSVPMKVMMESRF